VRRGGGVARGDHVSGKNFLNISNHLDYTQCRENPQNPVLIEVFFYKEA